MNDRYGSNVPQWEKRICSAATRWLMERPCGLRALGRRGCVTATAAALAVAPKWPGAPPSWLIYVSPTLRAGFPHKYELRCKQRPFDCGEGAGGSHACRGDVGGIGSTGGEGGGTAAWSLVMLLLLVRPILIGLAPPSPVLPCVKLMSAGALVGSGIGAMNSVVGRRIRGFTLST